MSKEAVYPFKNEPYYAYSNGRTYKVCQDGDVLIAREHGIKLGEVRMFFTFSSEAEAKQNMFFAERRFRPFFWPFIAPRIWWRKIK